jgi:hypothetical protein
LRFAVACSRRVRLWTFSESLADRTFDHMEAEARTELPATSTWTLLQPSAARAGGCPARSKATPRTGREWRFSMRE